MKGLTVAESFFREWGMPYLQQEHPQIADRIAAGRIFGSDVLGADDKISRDHNWGPQFFLFLSEADFVKYGARLEKKANEVAPNPWQRFRLAGAEDKSVHVVSIPRWFKDNLGLSALPTHAESWTGLSESNLYFLKHAAIWVDRTGELSEWRQSLTCYPKTVKNNRLAEEIFRVWHYGEYNFVQRMAKRLDPLSISMCLGQFTEGVMRLTMLLNDDYSPYWKWLAHEFRKQPQAERLVPLLDLLLKTREGGEQVDLIKQLCAAIRRELVSTGVITGDTDKPYLLPLFNAYNELKAKAEAAQLCAAADARAVHAP